MKIKRCAKCRKVIVRNDFPRHAGFIPMKEETNQAIAVRKYGVCECRSKPKLFTKVGLIQNETILPFFSDYIVPKDSIPKELLDAIESGKQINIMIDNISIDEAVIEKIKKRLRNERIR